MSDIGTVVRITDPTHPHCGRVGTWQGAKKMPGLQKPMGEIKFTDHGPGIGGPDGCFVSPGQIEIENVKQTSPRRKRR
jgi:hypothetical protein